MKILEKNEKENLVKVKVEDPNDVWELEHVLEEGDVVSAKTLRRKMIERKDGEEKGEKRPVFLTIQAEKIRFHEHTGNLRITGEIVDGPEDVERGNYHTIVAEPGKIITIRKKEGWEEWQMKVLRRAYQKPPRVLVCVLDRQSATVAEVETDVKIMTEMESDVPGKQYDSEGGGNYLGDVLSILERNYDRFDRVVVAGPGFMKDRLMERIKKEDEGLFEKVTKASTSHTGSTGVQEVIKRGVIDKIVQGSRISQESEEVENFFTEVSKDTGEVTYGEEEVERAVEMGAAKKILVSEKMLKEFRDIIKEAENKGADVLIVSERHEAGEKLKKFGGIAAFLRYRIN
ncbi:MAG: mRNA surveillance protein pelota [Candidatus Aenigmatarchaeota archaeon]